MGAPLGKMRDLNVVNWLDVGTSSSRVRTMQNEKKNKKTKNECHAAPDRKTPQIILSGMMQHTHTALRHKCSFSDGQRVPLSLPSNNVKKNKKKYRKKTPRPPTDIPEAPTRPLGRDHEPDRVAQRS